MNRPKPYSVNDIRHKNDLFYYNCNEINEYISKTEKSHEKLMRDNIEYQEQLDNLKEELQEIRHFMYEEMWDIYTDIRGIVFWKLDKVIENIGEI